MPFCSALTCLSHSCECEEPTKCLLQHFFVYYILKWGNTSFSKFCNELGNAAKKRKKEGKSLCSDLQMIVETVFHCTSERYGSLLCLCL